MPQLIEVPGMGQVEFPDGMLDEQIVAAIRSNRPSLKQSNPTEYDPSSPEFKAKYADPTGSTFENVAAGGGKFFKDLEVGLAQRLGHVPAEAVAQMRQGDQPLMDTKAGKAGYIGTGLAVTAPTLAIPGVNTVTGSALAGGAMGALQPTAPGESALLNTALGAGLGAAGQKAGTAVGNFATRKIAERTTAKAAEQASNVVRDTTLMEAQAAGYVVPPSQVNPSNVNRLLESTSGKAATQQSATFRNQKVTNRLIREDLGLPVNAPLTYKTLQNVRTLAGQAYKDVKATGSIATDNQYLTELTDLTKSADKIAIDFPDFNVASSEGIQKLQNALLRDKFDAESAVEMVKKLRDESTDNLAFNVTEPGRKALGLAQREAAGIVEDQVIRHLQLIGKADLAKKFDKARTTIAKAHSVRGALNEGTGNVNAGRLATELRKGKPLSDGIQKAAKFAAAFPKVSGEQLTSPGVSALDAMIGIGGGVAVNPALAAVPLSRYAARGTILSKPFQSRLQPNYLPSTMKLRGLGSGAKLLPASSVVLPGYLGQQESFK